MQNYPNLICPLTQNDKSADKETCPNISIVTTKQTNIRDSTVFYNFKLNQIHFSDLSWSVGREERLDSHVRILNKWAE